MPWTCNTTCSKCGWEFAIGSAGVTVCLSEPSPPPFTRLDDALLVAVFVGGVVGLGSGILGKLIWGRFFMPAAIGFGTAFLAAIIQPLTRLPRQSADAAAWRELTGTEAEELRKKLERLEIKNHCLTGSWTVLDVHHSNSYVRDYAGPFYHLRGDCKVIRGAKYKQGAVILSARFEYGCLIDMNGVLRIAAPCEECC